MLSADEARRAVTLGASLSYLCAFCSNYQQTSGLQSPEGIIPVGRSRPELPLLMWPFRRADIGIDVLCLCGMGVSAACVVSRRCRTSEVMLLLWYLFTTLQPDDPPLLQDAGFVAVLLAPMRGQQHAELGAAVLNIGLSTARWLMFLVFYESGTGKLLGGSEQWWRRTAMSHHYQSQPLPAPGAWLMHWILPEWLHQHSVSFMLAVETCVPLLS